MARVFVTRALPGDALDRLRDAGHDVDVWPGDLPPHPTELRERARRRRGPALPADRPRRRRRCSTRRRSCEVDRQLRRRLRQHRPRRRAPSAASPSASRPTSSPTRPPTSPSRSCSPPRGASPQAARRGPRRALAHVGAAGLARRRRPRRDARRSSAPGASARPSRERAAGFDMDVVSIGRDDDLHARARAAPTSSRCTPRSPPQTRHLIDAAALPR